jgi:acyl carrier protein
MDINDFIKNFASLMEETDTSKFTAQTRFRDEIEEWSSLTALSVIAMVDAEYNISIKGEDIRKSDTIEDIFNIVKSRK